MDRRSVQGIWQKGTPRPQEALLTTVLDGDQTSGIIALGGGNASVSGSPAAPSNGRIHVSFDDVTFEQLMPGDFDNNKAIDASDIDLLANELQQNAKRRIFDMNNDDAVSFDDHGFLVTNLGGFAPGDTNLDGIVDFTDFVALSAGFGRRRWLGGRRP